MTRAPVLVLVAALIAGGALAAATLAAAAAGRASEERLTVLAAASLTEALRALDPSPRYAFGSSGALETQIRQGAPADVFAAASTVNPRRLHRAGLVERPSTFARNRLALIVPRENPAGIRTVADLARGSVRLVVASPAAPLGGYTATALRRLGLSSALRRVVSREPDAKAVVGKVVLAEADAGIVYATDVRPVRERVTVIPLPARAQPVIRYEAAVVAGSPRAARARAWIRALLSPRGQAVLRRAGFLPAAGA